MVIQVKKVLLAGIDEKINAFMQKKVEGAGHVVRVVTKYPEVVPAYQEFLPDVLLISIMWKEKTAVQLIKQLGALEKSDTLVLLYSHYKTEDIARRMDLYYFYANSLDRVSATVPNLKLVFLGNFRPDNFTKVIGTFIDQ